MRKRPFWLWLALAAAIVLAGFSAFIALGAVINIFSPRHGGVGLGTSIATAAISIVVLAVCVRWAVHVEHRLRSRGSGSTARAGLADGRRPGRARPVPGEDRYRLHHHRHGPVAVMVAAVIFTLVLAGVITGTVQSFGAWRLTSYVQAHGQLASATVVTVRNIKHSSRSRTWYTAVISARLRRPVHGVTATTVYDPDGASLLRGDPLTVLVDPQQPGYSELPGEPYSSMADWLIGIVFCLIVLLITVVYWHEATVRFREHRRAARLAYRAAT